MRHIYIFRIPFCTFLKVHMLFAQTRTMTNLEICEHRYSQCLLIHSVDRVYAWTNRNSNETLKNASQYSPR